MLLRSAKNFNIMNSNDADASAPSSASNNSNTSSQSSQLINYDILKGELWPRLCKPPQFLGNNKTDFPIWQQRFSIFLTRKGLDKVLEEDNPCPIQNCQVYADIVDAVDDISLGLILNDAKNDGKKAYNILIDYYLGSHRARKNNTIKDLIRVSLKSNETIIQFTCRVDRMRDTLAQYNLKDDDLIITCVLNGLPKRFDTFCTIINSVEDFPSWEIFKLKLHSFSDSKAFNESYSPSIISSVRDGSGNAGMRHTGAIPKHPPPSQTARATEPVAAASAAPNEPSNKRSRPTIQKPKLPKYKKNGKGFKKCTKCLGRSHKTEDCKSNKYCNTCKNYSHDTDRCWKNIDKANRGSKTNH